MGGGYVRIGKASGEERQQMIQILFGSDPAKAPLSINRWGAGTEVLRSADSGQPAASAFFGFMKSSKGQSVLAMQRELSKEKTNGDHLFEGIISRVDDGRALSTTVPYTSNQDFDLHQYAEAEKATLQQLESNPSRHIRRLDGAARQACPRAGEFLSTTLQLIDDAVAGRPTPVSLLLHLQRPPLQGHPAERSSRRGKKRARHPARERLAPSIGLIAISRKRTLRWRAKRQAPSRHSTSCSARRETCAALPFRSPTNQTGGSKSFSTSRRTPRNPTNQVPRRGRRLNMNKKNPCRFPKVGRTDPRRKQATRLGGGSCDRQEPLLCLGRHFRASTRPCPAQYPIPWAIPTSPGRRIELSQALETVSALGYQGVQLLGWVQQAYAGEKTAELKDRLQKLKLSPAALSCSKVKLRPDSPENFTAQFREYADFLHSLGGNVLQLIDGGKPRATYSANEIKSMGAKMNELGKMAKDSGMTRWLPPAFRDRGRNSRGTGNACWTLPTRST